jgi:hypothetical protein
MNLQSRRHLDGSDDAAAGSSATVDFQKRLEHAWETLQVCIPIHTALSSYTVYHNTTTVLWR